MKKSAVRACALILTCTLFAPVVLMADVSPKVTKRPITEDDVRLVECDVILNDVVAATSVTETIKRIAANHRGFVAKVDERTRHAVIVVPVSRASELSREALVKSAALAAPSTGSNRIERMKPIAMTSTPWNSGTFQYDGAGNITAIGSDTYSYDSVNRLKQSKTKGINQSFQYDEFGNRTTQDFLNGQCTGGYDCALDVAVDHGTNKLLSTTILGQTQPVQYDSAGNMTSFMGFGFTWDALGVMTSRSDGGGRQFVYDEDDERIGSFYATNWSWTIRDVAGRVLREYSTGTNLSTTWTTNAWNWHNDQIYRGDHVLASVGNQVPYGGYQPVTQHFHLDHLGSTRLVTVSGGESAFHYYFPFGTELGIAPVENPVENIHKFTGHENEETNNGVFHSFYMHARYYNASAGRFLSMDPSPGDPTRPQSWNRYAYVANNPLTSVDPTGKCGEGPDFVGPTLPCDWGLTGEITVTARDPFWDFLNPEGWFGGNDGSSAPAPPERHRDSIKDILCRAIPSGRATGVSGSLGAIGSGVAGGEVVVNYNSGQVSAFAYGGLQVGWNGVAAASAYSGFVYGLNDTNANYAGGFTGANGGLGIGGFTASSSGGLSHGAAGLKPDRNVTVYGASIGASLVGAASGGLSATNYTKPAQLGKYWGFPTELDWALFAIRQGCK